MILDDDNIDADVMRPPSPITHPASSRQQQQKNKKKNRLKREMKHNKREMSLQHGKKNGKDYQMQFLGLKWRFLRSDLEKESFPPLPKRPVLGADAVSQHNIAKSAILDTYLHHLRLTGVDDLQSLDSFDYSSMVPVSRLSDEVEEVVVSSDMTSTQEKVQEKDDGTASRGHGSASRPHCPTASTSSSTFTSYPSSELTEADVLVALQHMQIFASLPPPSLAPFSSVSNSQQEPDRTPHAPNPRPITHLTPAPPSSPSSRSCSGGRALRIRVSNKSNLHISHTNTRNTSSSSSDSSQQKRLQPFARHIPRSRASSSSSSAADTDKERHEKMKNLPICRIFKQYVVERGLRVPKCVSKAANI